MEKKQETLEKILSIMKDMLHISPNESIEDIEKEPLLGVKFQMRMDQMVYLMMAVEKEFEHRFSEKELMEPGIRTLGDIVELVG